MKRCGLLLLGALVLGLHAFGQSAQAQAERQARSVHLYHEAWGKQAEIFYIEGTVSDFWPGSYFCLLGFDGGYAGVQKYPNGMHLAIFSVWEPSDPFDFTANPDAVEEAQRTKLLYAGDGVKIARFGGEGSGGQSRIENFAWEIGQPIRMAISCAPDGKYRTAYTCWIWCEAAQAWFRMATFSTLYNNGRTSLGGPYSFLEDFWRNGESRLHVRRASLTPLWAYHQGAWRRAKAATFSADDNALTTIDAGPDKGGFWFATGGDLTNSTIPLGKAFPPGPGEDTSALRRAKLVEAVKAAQTPATPPTPQPPENPEA